MQTLLFEMKPHEGHEEHYFAHVAALRPLLQKQQGLLFIQRYKSLSRPNTILSHSLWRNEKSIVEWRNNQNHIKSQSAGRYKHFEDYRIRISNALYCHADQSDHEPLELNSVRTQSIDSPGRFITIIRGKSVPNLDCLESFKSVTDRDSFLSVSEFSSYKAGLDQCLFAQSDSDTISTILASVTRDYGLHDRAEAPQKLRPVES